MELMVTLIIVGIVVGIGIPSFRQLIRGGELTSRANSIIVAMQLARSEAISRGRPVMACPSTDGLACGGSWAEGWLVATDGDTAGTVDGNDEILRVEAASNELNANGPEFVRFTADGLNDSDVAQVIRLERPDCGTGRAREIRISATGRAQVNDADC